MPVDWSSKLEIFPVMVV